MVFEYEEEARRAGIASAVRLHSTQFQRGCLIARGIMNTPSILAAVVLAAATLGAAEPPPAAPVDLDFKAAGPSSVSITAKETASSRAITRNWETYYGSYDRDFARGKTLTIDLVNLGRVAAPDDTHVEVLWFSQKVADRKAGIFHRQTQPVKLGALGRGQVTAEMPTLGSRVMNYAAIRERYVSGSKFLGWAALLRSGTTVSAYRCSNPTIESLVKDPGKLTPLLEDFAAASRTAAAAQPLGQ